MRYWVGQGVGELVTGLELLIRAWVIKLIMVMVLVQNFVVKFQVVEKYGLLLAITGKDLFQSN